jgi:hypothetical protein
MDKTLLLKPTSLQDGHVRKNHAVLKGRRKYPVYVRIALIFGISLALWAVIIGAANFAIRAFG